MFMPRVSATARINLGMLVIVSGLVAAAPYVPAATGQPHPAPTVCTRQLGEGWAIVSSADVERPAASAAATEVVDGCR